MEAERDNLVVIFAGYKDRMDEFFRSNPGLSSRVAHHIDFPDYDIDELMAIADLMMEQQNYKFGPGAEEAFRAYLERRGARPPFAHRRRVRHSIDRPRPRPADPPVRAGPQRPKLDRPRTSARGDPAFGRGAGCPQPRRPDDDQPGRHPQVERLRRGSRAGRRRADSGRALVMARSITLGVVGDSAAGKTTLTRGLVRVLGEENVTHVCVDDYHRYDRRQRAQRNITPLHPDCNYMDMIAQH